MTALRMDMSAAAYNAHLAYNTQLAYDAQLAYNIQLAHNILRTRCRPPHCVAADGSAADIPEEQKRHLQFWLEVQRSGRTPAPDAERACEHWSQSFAAANAVLWRRA